MTRRIDKPAPRRSARARPRPASDLDGRERILRAAIRSFADVGYAGTTTVEIARVAGVTHPNVHHHFGSKEGLWRAAVERVFADVARVVAPAEGDTRTGVEFLEAVVTRFVRLAAETPDLSRILARESAAPGPRLTYLLETYLQAPLAQAVEAIRQGQRDGLVGAGLDPQLLLFAAIGAGGHLFNVPALAREAFGIDVAAQDTRDAFTALVRNVLLHGLLARGER